MSNFLQLAQDLRRECGISGTGPTTVVSQTGELLRVVNWIIASWKELQNHKNNWRWMRAPFTVQTVAAVDTYAYGACTDVLTSALISRFKRWYPKEFQIYLTTSGIGTSHWLTEFPWDSFKRIWKVGNQNNGYPAAVAIDPQNNFRLGAKPNDIYTVTGDYQRSAQVLAIDTDVPEMPADFHQLIVFRGMKKYAAFAGASEVWASAKDQHAQMMLDLMLDQLPQPGFGEPLA